MFKSSLLLVAIGFAICLIPSTGRARFLESWPYDKLMKKSDLVIIGRAVKTEVTNDEPPIHGWNFEFVGQNTTFDVKSKFKGECGRKANQSLALQMGRAKGLDLMITSCT